MPKKLSAMNTNFLYNKVPFLDLGKINKQYRSELVDAATRVIDSGYYIHGPEYDAFCKELSEYVGVQHTIGTGNGLDALRLVLKAWMDMGKLQEGDEVIVPANTFIATILAITDNRLKPVLVEPNEKTFNINAEGIRSHLTEKTKAIVVVHLYGRVAWSEELEAMKKEGKYLILEDNAQAIGATWKGRKTGSLGHAAAFSFYPGKNLGALGDGGAVSTNDTELADMVKALSSYGSRVKYVHELKGVNSRLDEMQAALLRVKLRYVDWENQKRKDVARMYVKHFKNDNIILPEIPADEDEHVWHLFVLRVKNREAFREHMEDHGVMTLIHYPIAPHKQAAYKELAHLNLPISEQLHEEVVSLPISQIMSVDQVYQVLKACEQFSK
jgi:dTDP-4-amino-4,6-dideoxygalactose transaminase